MRSAALRYIKKGGSSACFQCARLSLRFLAGRAAASATIRIARVEGEGRRVR
jgi:hypothetical protein